VHCRVKQSAKHTGTRELERMPKLAFRASVLLANWLQNQKNAAVGQICSADDVLDAVHQQRARRLKEDFVTIGIELAHRETAAAR
jgi:hypothetical protein